MTKRQIRRWILGGVCGGLAWLAVISPAAEPPEPGQATLDRLLRAVEQNDYDTFVAGATAQFKAALTRQMMEGVSAQLAPRMKRGFAAEYLGELKQSGARVLLWKLTFSDGGDDTLAKLALQDDQVAGFLLQ
jgi:hypothetical protein